MSSTAPHYSKSAHDVSSMFGRIAHRYDLVNDVLSGGLHHLWRRQILAMLPRSFKPKADQVLDLCCGTGAFLPLLKRRFGGAHGADFTLAMLERAKRFEDETTILHHADALHLPFADKQFALITIAFGVRNFADLAKGLQESARVLAPEGRLLVLEFGQPRSTLFAKLYHTYSRFVMPYIGGLLSGDFAAYRYLPSTAAAFPCGEQFAEALRSAGFKEITWRALNGGIVYAYSAVR